MDKEAIKAGLAMAMMIGAALPAIFGALAAPVLLLGLLFRGLRRVGQWRAERSWRRYAAGDPRDSVLAEARNRLGGSLMSLKPAGMDELLAKLRLRESLAIDFTRGDWHPDRLLVFVHHLPQSDGSRPVEIRIAYGGKDLFRGTADLDAIAAENRW